MTDYNCNQRSISRSQGLEERDFTGVSGLSTFASKQAEGTVFRNNWTGVFGVINAYTITYYINRGKNTGVGAAFLYWVSPLSIDLVGAYYDGAVPFIQLTDIVVVGTFT